LTPAAGTVAFPLLRLAGRTKASAPTRTFTDQYLVFVRVGTLERRKSRASICPGAPVLVHGF